MLTEYQSNAAMLMILKRSEALSSQAATPVYGQAGWLLMRASEAVSISNFHSTHGNQHLACMLHA